MYLLFGGVERTSKRKLPMLHTWTNKAPLRTDCQRKESLHLLRDPLVPQASAHGPHHRHLCLDHTYASYSANEIVF